VGGFFLNTVYKWQSVKSHFGFQLGWFHRLQTYIQMNVINMLSSLKNFPDTFSVYIASGTQWPIYWTMTDSRLLTNRNVWPMAIINKRTTAH